MSCRKTARFGPAVLVGAAAFLLLPGAAAAQATYQMISPADLQALLAAEGAHLTIERNAEGPYLFGFTDEEVEYSIFFYLCEAIAKAETCGALQYHAGFADDTAFPVWLANDWNATRWDGTAYRHGDGSIVISMTLPLLGGVTPEYFAASLTEWDIVLFDFLEHIDWYGEGSAGFAPDMPMADRSVVGGGK